MTPGAGNNRGCRRWVARSGLLLIAAMLVSMRFSIVPMASGLAADDETIHVRLSERNNSGVTGAADLTASDGDTRIRVSVQGDAATYLPFLHRGTCSDFNKSISIPLSQAAPGSPSETTVDLDLKTLTAGDRVIDLHVAEGTIESLMDPASSVACGVIEQAGITDSNNGVQAPVAGIGPFDVGDDWNRPSLVIFLGGAILAALAGLRTGRIPPPVQTVVIDVVARHRLRGLFP